MIKLEKVGPIHYRLRDYGYGDVRINVDKFQPYKETPQGWWVIDELFWPSCCVFHPEQLKRARRWVPKESPRYCSPDIEAALYSFKRRKASQLKHLHHKLQQAEQVQKGLELLGKEPFPVDGYNCGTPDEWAGIVWE